MCESVFDPHRKLFPSVWSEGIGVTGEDPCLEELGFECIYFGLRCEVSSVRWLECSRAVGLVSLCSAI